MKAAHTSSMVQDRKQCDASQTPAGGTDSTAACRAMQREKERHRQTGGRVRRIKTKGYKGTNKENNTTTHSGGVGRSVMHKTHSQA